MELHRRIINSRGDFGILMRSKEPDCCPYIHQMCRNPCKARHCLSQCVLSCGSEGNPKCKPITCEEANPKQCEANPNNVTPWEQAHPAPGGDPSAWGPPPDNNPFDNQKNKSPSTNTNNQPQPGGEPSDFAPPSDNSNSPFSSNDDHDHFHSGNEDHDHDHEDSVGVDHSHGFPSSNNNNPFSSSHDHDHLHTDSDADHEDHADHDHDFPSPSSDGNNPFSSNNENSPLNTDNPSRPADSGNGDGTKDFGPSSNDNSPFNSNNNNSPFSTTNNDSGPSSNNISPSSNSNGPSSNNAGPGSNEVGPSNNSGGPSDNEIVPESNDVGPSSNDLGPSNSGGGPSINTKSPKSADNDEENSAKKCDENYTKIGDKCFALMDKPTSWLMGLTACMIADGTIATVHSKKEQDALLQLTGGKKSWIGLKDFQDEGHFTWMNQDPVVYTNWASGEPSGEEEEDCVAMGEDGTWSDEHCKEDLPYICQKDLQV